MKICHMCLTEEKYKDVEFSFARSSVERCDVCGYQLDCIEVAPSDIAEKEEEKETLP